MSIAVLLAALQKNEGDMNLPIFPLRIASSRVSPLIQNAACGDCSGWSNAKEAWRTCSKICEEGQGIGSSTEEDFPFHFPLNMNHSLLGGLVCLSHALVHAFGTERVDAVIASS